MEIRKIGNDLDSANPYVTPIDFIGKVDVLNLLVGQQPMIFEAIGVSLINDRYSPLWPWVTKFLRSNINWIDSRLHIIAFPSVLFCRNLYILY